MRRDGKARTPENDGGFVWRQILSAVVNRRIDSEDTPEGTGAAHCWNSPHSTQIRSKNGQIGLVFIPVE